MKENNEVNEMAIYIVNITKRVIEAFLSNNKDKKSFKEILPEIKIEYKNLNKKHRQFNLDLFDNANKFYEDLVGYFNYNLQNFLDYEDKYIFNFSESSFATINFSILTDLLLQILGNDKKAYLDDIVKFDITVLCEIFA